MEIKKIDSQPSFGTKVLVHPNLFTFWDRAVLKECEHYSQLLAKNGKNDVMTLSLSTNLQNSVEGIKAFVFENKGKKFIFSQTILSAAHERDPRGGYHCPNLVDLYENCMEYTYKRFNNSDKFNINLIG